MMNSALIFPIIQGFASALRYDHPDLLLRNTYRTEQRAQDLDIRDFVYQLQEEGEKVKLVFMENYLPQQKAREYINHPDFPILFFIRNESAYVPVLFYADKKNQPVVQQFPGEHQAPVELPEAIDADALDLYSNEEGKVAFLTAFPFQSVIGEQEEEGQQEISPLKRLLSLLNTEKKDIMYIYVYAIAVGIISLALPLGTQAIVGFISGGMWFNSVILLISLVIIGIAVAGGLQIMQISMVEVLQRRIFVKAAYEFTYRIPKINSESLFRHHAPELMNRFFDILTLQKGLPKLLIDFSTAILQIFFSLLLISFYHPFFVFFSLLLITTLIIIFYVTGPKGLKSSIKESKYKYQVVFWLEELARALNSFKVTGSTHLPMKKSDENINHYLAYRKKHFSVLIRQFSYIVIFKTVITAGLLIIGTMLVIDRQITLGQFVASEIIIVLVLNAVEKIIIHMDTVYDMLTAVDKIGHVTDLPLERTSGFKASRQYFDSGLDIRIKNLSYTYPDSREKTLSNINLHIQPGEKICIAGYHSSGKTTLINILGGNYASYEGSITFNGLSLRDLDLNFVRDHIAKNISEQDIFDGTVLENITVGKPHASYELAVEAIRAVGADEEINNLPQGYHTHLVSGGKTLSSGMAHKLILARCIAKKPRVMILNDFFQVFEKSEKLKLLRYLTDKKHHWTLIIVSNDPIVIQACNRVVILKDGEIVSNGSADTLVQDKHYREVVLV